MNSRGRLQFTVWILQAGTEQLHSWILWLALTQVQFSHFWGVGLQSCGHEFTVSLWQIAGNKSVDQEENYWARKYKDMHRMLYYYQFYIKTTKIKYSYTRSIYKHSNDYYNIQVWCTIIVIITSGLTEPSCSSSLLESVYVVPPLMCCTPWCSAHPEPPWTSAASRPKLNSGPLTVSSLISFLTWGTLGSPVVLNDHSSPSDSGRC